MNGLTDSIRKLTFTILAASLGWLTTPAAQAKAVTVTWDTPTTVSSPSDVSTSGSLLYAYHFGDAGVPSVTVNGVTFTSFAVTNGSAASVTVGSVTVSETLSTWVSDNTSFGTATAGAFTALDSNYQALLQSGLGEASAGFTLTLDNLLAGNHYQVEVWTNDSGGAVNSVSSGAQTQYLGGPTTTLDSNVTNAVSGVGQFMTGTFAASSTSISIIVNSLSDHPEINAIEVRAVPEPATVALLGGAGFALLLRRR